MLQERPLKDGTPSAWVAHDVFGFGFTATDNCDKDEADPEADPVDSFKSLLPLESNGKAAVSICKSLAQGTEEPANAVFIGHSMGVSFTVDLGIGDAGTCGYVHVC